MTNGEIILLKRVLDYIDVSETRVEASVYISPAQRLRNRADRLEQQEADFHTLGDLIRKKEQGL